MPKLPDFVRFPRVPKPQLAHVLRVVVLAGALAESWLLWHTASAQEAVRLATSHQPETYTELYFTNASNLPKRIEPRQPVTFRYDVVNHTARDRTYTVYVTIVENGVPRLLQTDTPVVKAGTGTTLSVPFSTRLRGADLQLRVELPAENQSIHFRGTSAP